MTPLTAEGVRERAMVYGASFFGVADLALYREQIDSVYGKYDAYDRAISIGVRLPVDVVNELLALGPTPTYTFYYQAVNHLLDDIAIRITNDLATAGYRAYPIPSSQIVSDKGDMGIFSHRIAARLAGIGWIGKSCNLITAEAGPRVRFATILTDAPLEAGSPVKNRCGNCTKCRDICPAHAIHGVPFKEGQARDVRLDFDKCNTQLQENAHIYGELICGLCLAACPWGSKNPKAAP